MSMTTPVTPPPSDPNPAARHTEALNRLVQKQCQDLEASPEKLPGFLQFFARISPRWSARNALALFAQRPNLKHPATIEGVKQLGHQLKPGAQPVQVLMGISPQLAERNAWLGFLRWSRLHRVGDRDLGAEEMRKLWKGHVAHCLDHHLLLGSPAANIALMAQVHQAYPGCDRQDAHQIADYALQCMNQTGAFDPAERQRAAHLWHRHAQARPCVYDLGTDTVGPRPKVTPGPKAGENAAQERRYLAAVVRFMESKGWAVDYPALDKIASPSRKLDSLVYATVNQLAHDHRKDVNAAVATYCIYAQLGIDRQFDVPTAQKGWGDKKGQLLAQAALIGKIQKEFTTGVKHELKTIERLEASLAQVENQAHALRNQLGALGLPPQKREGETPRALGAGTPPPVPLAVRTGRRRAEKPSEGMYFKIGPQSFLGYHEVAEFLASKGFLDRKGKPLEVELGRYDAQGRREVKYRLSSHEFARELLGVTSEPRLQKELGAQLKTAPESQGQKTETTRAEYETATPVSVAL